MMAYCSFLWSVDYTKKEWIGSSELKPLIAFAEYAGPSGGYIKSHIINADLRTPEGIID